MHETRVRGSTYNYTACGCMVYSRQKTMRTESKEPHHLSYSNLKSPYTRYIIPVAASATGSDFFLRDQVPTGTGTDDQTNYYTLLVSLCIMAVRCAIPGYL